MNNKLQVATLGGGCFWCTEAVFQEVKGVEKVISGYAGGNVPGEPTYREICSGLTGHAEVIEITYDERILSYEDIIVIFMTTHDPTTLNQQGADRGTQYRSVIYYHNEIQQKIADEVLKQIQPYYEDKVVTELSALPTFYAATQEHQDFYKNNNGQDYCTYVIEPKLTKLRKLHADKLK
jgi:peptide-methionine (S)-S-oxide reductase